MSHSSSIEQPVMHGSHARQSVSRAERWPRTGRLLGVAPHAMRARHGPKHHHPSQLRLRYDCVPEPSRLPGRLHLTPLRIRRTPNERGIAS
jgi:hypothetical protein